MRPEPQGVSLESAEEAGIPGLELLPEFVTREEEEALLQSLGGTDPDSMTASASAAAWERVSRRFVQHFGFRFDYAMRTFSDSLGPLPPLLGDLSARISTLASVGLDLNQVRFDAIDPAFLFI